MALKRFWAGCRRSRARRPKSPLRGVLHRHRRDRSRARRAAHGGAAVCHGRRRAPPILTLIARASEVTSECLQPSLTAAIAARWLSLDPKSMDAHRAAARAALALARIDESAEQYRIVLSSSPRGTDAELKDLETELEASDDVFAARRLADRLAADFPSSAAALRLAGFRRLRADDPAAAASDFSRALALTPAAGDGEPAPTRRPTGRARRELSRDCGARGSYPAIPEEPLASREALAERDATPANVLNYALLLLAASQDQAAIAQLDSLARDAESQAVALRLLGLVEFQNGDLDAAARHFTELLTTGKFVDDSFYYLGLIAERRGDLEKALRLYAQVQERRQRGRGSSRAREHHSADSRRRSGRAGDPGSSDRGRARSARRRCSRRARRSTPTRAMRDRRSRCSIAALRAISRQRRSALRHCHDGRGAGHVGAALQGAQGGPEAAPGRSGGSERLWLYARRPQSQAREARALIERAYAAAPRNAAILDSLGWVLYRQGTTSRRCLTWL
jgi:tetratricopeptide (TPR) repeat protein